MTVVLAPDSFKGSMSAARAAVALADGWRSGRPEDEVILRPMADGGEGTLDAFELAVPGATRMPVMALGPDGVNRPASWLLLPPTADEPEGIGVVELASTSGIELLGERLRPWDADTTGFGDAVAHALDHGVSRLVLGIGSSASTDGGAGLLTRLGVRLVDEQARPIGRGARGLATVSQADLRDLRPIPRGGVDVLCDVDNPLLGPSGAAAVFGPQKGFDASGVEGAEAALGRLAALLPADWAAPGTGAAGGTGFALLAWGARLVPGAEQVAALIGLPQAVADADVVITGEGRFDSQSESGKVPGYVTTLSAAAGRPVMVVAGSFGEDADVSPFTATASLTALAGSRGDALAHPEHWLRIAGASLARSYPDQA